MMTILHNHERCDLDVLPAMITTYAGWYAILRSRLFE